MRRFFGIGRAGFTLVELLVVIGIIAVLISILLPALAAARQAASSVQCMSNLRQLVCASMMYADSNNGYMPPGSDDFGVFGPTGNLHRWHGSRLTNDAGSPTSRFTFNGDPGSPLKKYLQNGAVKSCPTFLDLVTDGAETNSGGYGYNMDYIGSSIADSSSTINYRVAAKLTQIARPAEKIVFSDVATTTYYDSGWNPVNGLFEESFIYAPIGFWWDYSVQPPARQTYYNNPSMHFRHRKRQASVAWMDGHVTSEPFGWSYPGTTLETANIGWMLPANDTQNVLFRRD